MHLKSPLCHNKEEIDLGLACSPIPFSLEPRRTDRRTHTQRERAESVHEFIRLLASASFLQRSRCTHALGLFPGPPAPYVHEFVCDRLIWFLNLDWKHTSKFRLPFYFYLTSSQLSIQKQTYSYRGELCFRKIPREPKRGA